MIKKFFSYIRNIIKETFENIRIYFIRRWLVLWSWILRTYYSNKRILKITLLGIVLLGLVFILYTHYDKIVDYLCIRNTDSYGKLNNSFSSLFTAIGASIMGVLAITFALSLFAIQQAADKHTPTVLLSFLKDRINIYIFWSIASVSIIFFVFAILPLNEFIFFQIILTFILLLVVFFLLRKQYTHITRLVNPVHQIIFHHNQAINSLNKVDKWLDLMIRIKAIQSDPKNSGDTTNEKSQRKK